MSSRRLSLSSIHPVTVSSGCPSWLASLSQNRGPAKQPCQRSSVASCLKQAHNILSIATWTYQLGIVISEPQPADCHGICFKVLPPQVLKQLPTLGQHAFQAPAEQGHLPTSKLCSTHFQGACFSCQRPPSCRHLECIQLQRCSQPDRTARLRHSSEWWKGCRQTVEACLMVHRLSGSPQLLGLTLTHDSTDLQSSTATGPHLREEKSFRWTCMCSAIALIFSVSAATAAAASSLSLRACHRHVKQGCSRPHCEPACFAGADCHNSMKSCSATTPPVPPLMNNPD